MNFWEKLKDKGRLATLVGTLLAIPTVALYVWNLFMKPEFDYIPYIVSFAISLIFFILPSSVIVNFKDVKFKIDD